MSDEDKSPPKPRIVFTYDPESKGVRWDTEVSGFPLPLLVNALEMAKLVFVNLQFQQAAEKMAQQGQQQIVLPGGPMPPLRR